MRNKYDYFESIRTIFNTLTFVVMWDVLLLRNAPSDPLLPVNKPQDQLVRHMCWLTSCCARVGKIKSIQESNSGR